MLAAPPVRLRFALLLLIIAALPTSAAASPFAYVVAQRQDPGVGTGVQTLVVIDTATNDVETSIPLGLSCLFCFRASMLAVGAGGSRLFVANPASGTVSIVDVATHTLAGSVPVGGSPNGVVPSPDGARLYVLRGATIVVVDLDTLTVTRTFALPTSAATGGMAITPDGTRLYVGDFGGTRLVVVDTGSGAAQGFALSDRPVDLDITPDGSEVYVAGGESNRVFVVHTATNAVLPSILLGTTDLYPNSVRPTVNGTQVYVANLRGNTLSIVDRSTRTLVRGARWTI